MVFVSGDDFWPQKPKVDCFRKGDKKLEQLWGSRCVCVCFFRTLLLATAKVSCAPHQQIVVDGLVIKVFVAAWSQQRAWHKSCNGLHGWKLQWCFHLRPGLIKLDVTMQMKTEDSGRNRLPRGGRMFCTRLSSSRAFCKNR